MIEIEQSAALNTVQDAGRPGWRDIGVSVSGVMDPLALRAGNILLGNDENSAAIEIQLFPFRVTFLQDTAIALTGADCRALLDGQPLPGWWACPVKKGQQLELRFPRSGARGYLCVAGGIEVAQVLGSRSTSLRGEFGGMDGRPLRRGDCLAIGSNASARLPAGGIGVEPPQHALHYAFPRNSKGEVQIRAIPSGEYHLFSSQSDRFWQQSWKVSMQSNRTGYRLSGTPLQPSETIELRSYGLIPGIIQVPPAGEPIIQLSDANTAGGYPKIACVIEEDLWLLGQIQPGESLQLVQTDYHQAKEIRALTERWLDELRTHVALWRHAVC
ncbi:5-oxoprolinase subunit C family protein [Tatumella citrea]|uniref:Allophanate hydrolase n=1 Tax=Tatumella citrea TaxID=53336 RepID=A0A1Y0LFM4_TATCI|nr:biotin-dependent carboxyltransferase family protein [Tatumella citrea]ARU92843.1 allophanate hydrolase [Tatumella citrea]ARU96881.1 allophanate hydrolase [Tatumella citrea]